jgi:hypothetical protein
LIRQRTVSPNQSTVVCAAALRPDSTPVMLSRAEKQQDSDP